MQQHGSKYYARRTPHPGDVVKIQLFPNMAMLHIKLKGNDTCSNIIEQIFHLQTPLWVRLKSDIEIVQMI